MPRAVTEFVCQQCASQYPQLYGRCPSCGAWGSLEETRVGTYAESSLTARRTVTEIQNLDTIQSSHKDRISVAVEEFDRVLGGGIVPGSAILLGGDPGVGKSTLLLQISRLAGASGFQVLYATGEESPEQLRLRADRLGPVPDGIGILAESNVDDIIAAAVASAPSILVIDSIQTMRTSDLESGAGGISQIRECAARLVQLAKSTGIAVFLVGHVTKEGNLAGPKVLEHMVDVVLYLEGDHFQAYRLLRSIKNRYGASHEIGVFDMRETGLTEVANPSSLFLNEGADASSGSAIAVTVEGTRPLVVEIQALSTKTSFGLPRRASTGFDLNRLYMLTAVLSKRAHIDVSSEDIYVNVVGGLKLVEPAVDLAAVLAIYSSHRDIDLDRTAIIGEVGLGGEVRPIQQMSRRLHEAAKIGIQRAIIPKYGAPSKSDLPDIRVDTVESVTAAIAATAR